MKRIIINFKNNTKTKISKDIFEEISKKAVTIFRPKKNIIIDLILVGERKIKALNKKYLGSNRITDVLSFPISLTAEKNQPILLGDIYICIPFVKKQIKKLKTNLSSEIRYLFIHGLLHLFGYNHSGKDKKNWQEVEKKFGGVT